jgi:hypothetical protein
MFGAKPLMKENVLGAPPSKSMLRKKIFGKPPTGKAAAPFGAPASPFPKGQSLNPFAGSNSGLAKRLTGK